MSNVPRTIYYPRSPSPCKDCVERHSGCHSECEKYGDWNKQRLQQKSKFTDEVIKNRRYADYVMNTIEGFKNGKWGKR